MTNDTNTLNGALKELGETMAANLTTQGVPSTYDEGLTTLAGKILDIVPGPGPTPTPSSISLTADKSILSYADSESATLSATVLDSSDNPLEGVTVTFYNGSTSMGTADTNSSGIASKTYSSAGVGDVSFTAEVGSLSSETYTIEDNYYYDSCSSNKTSNYTLESGLTLTFDTDHYILTSSTTTSKRCGFFEEISGDFELSAEIYATGRNMGIGVYKDDNNIANLYGVSSGTGLVYNNNGTHSTNRTSTTLSTTIWYRFRIQKTGSTIVGIIETLDGTKFGEWTISLSGINKAFIVNGWNYTAQYKNIKIKPL